MELGLVHLVFNGVPVAFGIQLDDVEDGEIMDLVVLFQQVPLDVGQVGVADAVSDCFLICERGILELLLDYPKMIFGILWHVELSVIPPLALRFGLLFWPGLGCRG